LIGGEQGKRRWRRLEEGDAPNTWARGVSDTQGKEGARSREPGRWRLLGSAQAGKRGREDGPLVWEAGGPRAIGGCWAELG
jgi:hypothetical protein